MLVTPFGIFMLAKLLQPSKADLPMLVTLYVCNPIITLIGTVKVDP